MSSNQAEFFLTVNVLDKGIHGPRCDAQVDTTVAKIGHENGKAQELQ